MRSMVTFVAAAVAVAVLGFGLFAASAGGSARTGLPGHRCGSFKLDFHNKYGHYHYRYKVRAAHVPCQKARHVVKSYNRHPEQWKQHGDGTLATTHWTRRGWSCGHGSGGGGCHARGNRSKQIYYQVTVA